MREFNYLLFFCFIFILKLNAQIINDSFNGNAIYREESVDLNLKPFPVTSIEEASTGFQWPLPYNFSNNGGYMFLEQALYSGGWVYHPGQDWNVPGSPGGNCDGDQGLDVVAVANGTVIYVSSINWGNVVIQHLYQGQTWYSQYGHLQNVQVSYNQSVSKGQKIGEIGKTGLGTGDCSHLHFEIRESDHPNPANGSYWTYGTTGLGNSLNVDNWYVDPAIFIPNHPSYSTSTNFAVYADNQGPNSLNGWKFWKTLNQSFYRVEIDFGSLSGQYAIVLTRNGTYINGQNIMTNIPPRDTSFYYQPSSSLTDGGGYRFRVCPQFDPSTIIDESEEFYISYMPTLNITISPLNLTVNQNATLNWTVSGGIPGLPDGGWTGNIRLQWYQNNSPLINLDWTSVANHSYNFLVPYSIQGAAQPFTNFQIAGVNAETGTSLPPGYVNDFTDYFSITGLVGIENNNSLPSDFNIYQNYPNPFNPTTTIKYDLPKTCYTTLKIYNLLGQEIKALVNDYKQAGHYSVIWDGLNNEGNLVCTGIYLYKIQAGEYKKTRKLALIR